MTGGIGGLFAVAVGAGTLAGVLGLYGSYVFDAPSGAAIVLAATGLFGVAVAGRLASRARGPAGRAASRPISPSTVAIANTATQRGAAIHVAAAARTATASTPCSPWR